MTTQGISLEKDILLGDFSMGITVGFGFTYERLKSIEFINNNIIFWPPRLRRLGIETWDRRSIRWKTGGNIFNISAHAQLWTQRSDTDKNIIFEIRGYIRVRFSNFRLKKKSIFSAKKISIKIFFDRSFLIFLLSNLIQKMSFHANDNIP